MAYSPEKLSLHFAGMGLKWMMIKLIKCAKKICGSSTRSMELISDLRQKKGLSSLFYLIQAVNKLEIAVFSGAVTHNLYLALTDTWRATYVQRYDL